MNNSQVSIERDQPGFFDFAAEVGLTKHIGGVAATDALVALCHIDQGSYVLDVGCGAGATACFLAKRVGSRVVGVGILEGMVERSRERAAREKVADRVEFQVADAQDLPFEDGMFDARRFGTGRRRHHLIRYRVPGGQAAGGGRVCAGDQAGRLRRAERDRLVEVSPPAEVVAWAAQDVGASVKPLTPDEWTGLLAAAGLKEIVTQVYAVDVRDEAKGIVRRYGLGGTLRVLGRMLRLYARSPAYRKFVKGVGQQGVTPANLEEYFGYGLFVGRK